MLRMNLNAAATIATGGVPMVSADQDSTSHSTPSPLMSRMPSDSIIGNASTIATDLDSSSQSSLRIATSENILTDLESIPVTATVEKMFIPSAILQLPEEIRNRIYTYAMFPKGTTYAPRPHFSPSSCWRIKPPALLRTCYEMRRQALKIYYGHFHVTARSIEDVIPFLRSLNPDAHAALGKLSLKYDWYDAEHQAINQQVDKALAVLKMAGVGLKRAAVEVTGVVITD